MAHAYGVHLAAIGFLTSAVFLAHAAVQLPAGRAIDRYGARGVGIASLLAIAVGNVIALGFREFWVAVGARALMGLGTGAGFISGADYVRAAGGQAQMQGFYGGATLGATGLAVAIVPQLQGWRAPYWTALVLVLPVLVVLPFVPSTKRPPQRRSHLPVLSDRRLYRLSLLHTCSFGVSIVAGNWVVTLLVRSGHGHRVAALAGALTLIGGLVSRPGGGLVAAAAARPGARGRRGGRRVVLVRDPHAREPGAAPGPRPRGAHGRARRRGAVRRGVQGRTGPAAGRRRARRSGSSTPARTSSS